MQVGLARKYLLQALAMKRKKEKYLRERIAKGLCVIEGCERCFVSRGLCDSHRQAYYQALRQQASSEAKIEFESEQVREGNILAEGEQASWTTTNPFLKVS